VIEGTAPSIASAQPIAQEVAGLAEGIVIDDAELLITERQRRNRVQPNQVTPAAMRFGLRQQRSTDATARQASLTPRRFGGQPNRSLSPATSRLLASCSSRAERLRLTAPAAGAPDDETNAVTQKSVI
jgi:hypothetical protein